MVKGLGFDTLRGWMLYIASTPFPSRLVEKLRQIRAMGSPVFL